MQNLSVRELSNLPSKYSLNLNSHHPHPNPHQNLPLVFQIRNRKKKQIPHSYAMLPIISSSSNYYIWLKLVFYLIGFHHLSNTFIENVHANCFHF